MGVKDNFNQAVHEVFPFYKNSKADKTNIEGGAEPVDINSRKITPIMTSTVPKNSGYDPDYTMQEQPKIETTYITKDTKIIGTVMSMSNLDISGEVIGDIESQHGLRIFGKIEGNIKGKDVELASATIKGNILAMQRLHVADKSVVIGNISANELEFNGRINGNINVKKDISIQRESYITGDICAASVSIEKGAMIKGMVTTLGEIDGDGKEN